jgi:hypothetical protein
MTGGLNVTSANAQYARQWTPTNKKLNHLEWFTVLFAALVAHGFFVHEWLYPSCCDASVYAQLGHEIAEHGLFHRFTGAHVRTYGYPFLLSLLIRATAALGWPFQVVLFEAQLFLYLAGCLFFRNALMRVAPLAARIAFYGMLADYYVLIYAPESLTESVSLTLLVVAGGCWLKAYCKGGGNWPLVSGSFVVGFAVMVRPANLFIVVAWVTGAIVIGLRRRIGAVRGLSQGVCVVAALTLPMLPQLTNNVRNFGKWTPLVVFDLGQWQQSMGIRNIKYATGMAPVRQAEIHYYNPLWAGTTVDERVPWRWYVDNPRRGLLTLAIHTFNLTDQDLLFTYSRDLDPWYRLPLGLVNHGIVALGLLGLVLVARRVVAEGPNEQLDGLFVLLVMTGTNVAMLCWTAVEMRFGAVLLLVLFPFATYAIRRLIREGAARTLVVTTGAVAIYVALALQLSGWVRDQAPLIREAITMRQSRSDLHLDIEWNHVEGQIPLRKRWEGARTGDPELLDKSPEPKDGS